MKKRIIINVVVEKMLDPAKKLLEIERYYETDLSFDEIEREARALAPGECWLTFNTHRIGNYLLVGIYITTNEDIFDLYKLRESLGVFLIPVDDFSIEISSIYPEGSVIAISEQSRFTMKILVTKDT